MLTPEEYGKVLTTIGREPNKAELAILEAMWSEHCSYKSSKRWFHLFNIKAPYVFLGIGEGAGLVDIGDGLLIGLGLESHNHPSAISPFDGAATGVGGIIRDILSQGCKPIALLDSIRFGDLDSHHSRNLFENVVRGISFYGNCCGIPTVGGEVEFSTAYENNCLVNAMCVGLIEKEKVVRSIASKPGSFLILYGARTGKDGIHGVSFASKDLSDKSDKDRPAVQIGDPLMEKVVIDATLELVEEELLDGLQDLGGGGLSCAVSEMAEKGNTGAIIRIEDVPLREKEMESWEILVSESQERMLAVVSPNNVDRVQYILDRFDLLHAIIGEVTDNSHFITYYNGNKVSELPVDLVVNGCPEPERKLVKPDYMGKNSIVNLPLSENISSEISKLLTSPSIGDKSWVYQQYDQHVQTQTVKDAGFDAAVIRLDNGKYIALSLDCNSFMVYIDPFNGTANSAAEAMRNLVAMGAIPYALVDCLNYGNPEQPDSYWQFVESVKGLGQFSHDFQIPIVGGNVSFYNESVHNGKRERINPTPTIGMLGIIENESLLLQNSFQKTGNHVIVIGSTEGLLGGSEYLQYNHGIVTGPIPKYDFKRESNSIEAIINLNKNNLIESCHDISNGGLVVSSIEMTFQNKLGVKLTTSSIPSKTKLSLEEYLFTESPARYLIEVSSENLFETEKVLQELKVDYGIVGIVTEKTRIEINDSISLSIQELYDNWKNAIPKYMEE